MNHWVFKGEGIQCRELVTQLMRELQCQAKDNEATQRLATARSSYTRSEGARLLGGNWSHKRDTVTVGDITWGREGRREIAQLCSPFCFPSPTGAFHWPNPPEPGKQPSGVHSSPSPLCPPATISAEKGRGRDGLWANRPGNRKKLLIGYILLLPPLTSNVFGSNRVYLEKVLLPKANKKEGCKLEGGSGAWTCFLD